MKTPPLLLLLLLSQAVTAQQFPPNWQLADTNLAAYFESEVARIEARTLTDVRTLADWTAQRGERRRQLFDMLGLWPMPARTDLKPVITGVVDGEGFVVERLHFQSLPGLYVTANLYLPKNLPAPAPAILYVCGHAEVKTNGISFGNKTGYQHHGAWFARNGYVCLTLDTLQLGEIQGEHHGTHRLGQWWWNSRGYTPAGVEAWNGIRALDYLETRKDVDSRRLGMTGRSGGGSYTWTVAALDERVRAAAPVAGIADLRNHICDGAVEGHCDCMFFVNTHRWDFALNAALLAPRPLLIVNTDADSIFPLDGVTRVFNQARRLYGLHDAYDKLGLVIGPGPHKDSQNLQIPVFRWFNQHLKGEDPLISEAAEKRFQPGQLRVFKDLPADQRNTRAQEFFGPDATKPPGDLSGIMRALQERVFMGWPDDAGGLGLRGIAAQDHQGTRLRVVEFRSQEHVTLRLFVAEVVGARPARTRLHILDATGWTNWMASMKPRFAQALRDYPASGAAAVGTGNIPAPSSDTSLVFFVPRGLGPHAWPGDARKQVLIRRRFQLLGQTADGMRVWDIRRALGAASEAARAPLASATASGPMAVNLLYASVFAEPSLVYELSALPGSFHEAPDYLNVLQVAGHDRVLALMRSAGRRIEVRSGP